VKSSQPVVARRVAFHIYSLEHGGAERVTSILANKLSERDIEVTVFVMKAINCNSYRLAKDVRVVNVSMDPALENTGTGLLFNIRRLFVLRRLVKEFSPQVLYTMLVRGNVIGSFAMIGSGIPCVVSERNDPKYDVVSMPWRILRRIAYSVCHGVVAQTPRVEQWLRHNTKASTIKVISNPVEYPVPDGSPFIEVPSHRGPMIVAVGRLCPQKQFTHLIAVFSALTREFPDWWLAILGDGPDRESLATQISDARMTEKISLVGRVGNMSDWYREADIFVMTSRYEGYPNALIEAMASGVPAVSYDCPSGPADVIQDGVNGMLVEPDSTDELERKMRLVMSDSSLAAELSERALEVRELLDPDVILAQWLSVVNLYISSTAYK
jgi:glycosyltransferase involved in cell wall biosynthesis